MPRHALTLDTAGWETFLSYEDPERDILVGLLRLRKCSDMTFRPELTKDGQTSIVRELHGEQRHTPQRLVHFADAAGSQSMEPLYPCIREIRQSSNIRALARC